MSAMIQLSDDFEARITAAVRTAGGVPAKYMTFSGNPLASLVTDAAEGDEIAKDIRSRGRRWCVGDDVEWGPGAMQEFRAMRSGELKRSDSALKTKIDLREFESVSDFRFALSDSSGDAKYDARDLAKAITPARVDEAPSLFLASELTLLMPEIIRVERQMPYARTILPMRFLNAPGARYYRFDVFDDYGEAQWTSNFDGTPPVGGETRQEVTRPLHYMWMMARWGLRELLEWQQARSNGRTLPNFTTERPRGARESLLRLENYWLWFGGPTGSLILGLLSTVKDLGVVSSHGIPISTSANWANLTAEQIVALVTAAVTRITIGGVEVPNTILMPIGMYNFIATTQWPNTQMMILGVLMTALKPMGITEIVAVPEMGYRLELENKLKTLKYDDATAKRYAGGINGKDVMVVLSRNPAKVAGIVSQDVRSLPPEVRPTQTSVIQLLASGGCEVRYPLAHDITVFDAFVP